MLMMSSWLKRPWPPVVWFAALVAGLFCVAAAWPKAAGQISRAGRVVGYIDGFSYDGGQFHVMGWACQQGNPASVEVHVYADHSAYEKPPGTFVTAGRADLDSEAAIGKVCQDPRGGKHRFKIDLSNQALKTFQNRILYAHGIAVVGNVENSAIAQSGSKRFPEPRLPTSSRPAIGTMQSQPTGRGRRIAAMETGHGPVSLPVEPRRYAPQTFLILHPGAAGTAKTSASCSPIPTGARWLSPKIISTYQCRTCIT